MKKKKSNGFTLIELMIALLAGTFILLASASALIAGQTSLNRAFQKVELQRQGANVMLLLSHTIKMGSSAQVDEQGKTLTIHRNTGWVQFACNENNDLVTQVEGGALQTIIDNSVESLRFTVLNNKVEIDLRLKQNNMKTYFSSTVMLRNCWN